MTEFRVQQIQRCDAQRSSVSRFWALGTRGPFAAKDVRSIGRAKWAKTAKKRILAAFDAFSVNLSVA